MKSVRVTTISPTGSVDRYFSPGRWIKLLRADLVQYRNSLSIAAIAVFGAVLVVLVLFAPSTGSWQPHRFFLSSLLFLGGLIFTSYSFVELADPVRRSAYLLTPASTLEKIAARLLLTLVGFPLSVLALYWMTSALGAWLGSLAWGKSFTIYHPFTEYTSQLLTVYPVLHAIFFLGAVWFRKNAAFKTLLSMVVAQIAFTVVAVFIVRIVFFDFFNGTDFSLGVGSSMAWLDSVPWIARAFIYCLFVPWLWVIAYLRLADTEVR